MKTVTTPIREFEFSFPTLDTLVQVEELDHEVVIRATRNSFSERRKVHFIRELAAEGFIPESYRCFSGFGGGTWLRVRWLVDGSWLKLNETNTSRTRRFMIRLLACAALLWLGLMIGLFMF